MCLLKSCFLSLSSDTFHLLPGQTPAFPSQEWFCAVVITLMQQNWTTVWMTNYVQRNMILYAPQRPWSHRCLLGWLRVFYGLCDHRLIEALITAYFWLDGHAVLRHPKTLRYVSACTEECILNAVMSNKPALVKAFGKAAATVLSQSGYQQSGIGLLRKSSQECNNGMLLSTCFW